MSQDVRSSTGARVWRFARWTPVALIALAAAALMVLFLMGGLYRVTAWYLMQITTPSLGLITLIVVGVYALVRRRRGRAVVTTLAVSLLALLPGLLMVVPVAYPASLEHTEPIATVRVPADGPLKVVWGGDSIRVNQHAVVPDQRWAYDLLVEPYFTGSEQVEDYGCYGIPVLAPASGTVTAAHDGEPDGVPGSDAVNLTAIAGNFVGIRLDETGTYLLIAHLMPGSVLVDVGDVVEEGQEIGRCGNSGNTSEPHIHVHHQRQDPAMFPVNFAEGLPLYFRDHDGPPMPQGGVREEDGRLIATGDTVRHQGE